MASLYSQEKTSNFYILNYDKYVPRTSKQSLLETGSGTSKILKGTLLQRSPRKPSQSATSFDISVRSLDDENCEFDCSRVDVFPIQPAEKDLLIAVTSKPDRHRIYSHDKKTLEYGLTSKKGEWVHVRWKIDGVPEQIAGVIRYKGELPGQPGILFGVELEEFRGAGTSDGEFRKHRYFKCEEDCGIFVPLNRIKPRFIAFRKEKRDYKKTSNIEVDSALSPTELHIGRRVCVFMDEDGQKHGRVLYCGKPRFAKTEMVGIELDHSVKTTERSDGNYRGQRLFRPKHTSRTILIPKDSVFPAGNLVQENEPIFPPAYDPSTFDFKLGSWVNVETEQEGLRTGYVVWLDEGNINPESFVAVELDEACINFSEASDGTFGGRRLFYPSPEKVDRTVLTRAKSVTRSLSAGDPAEFDGRGRRGFGGRWRGRFGRRGRGFSYKSKVTIDYDAQNAHELQLRIGDIITVLDKNTGDRAWWKGELNGKVGLYPHNFTVAFREERYSAPPQRGGFDSADFDNHRSSQSSFNNRHDRAADGGSYMEGAWERSSYEYERGRGYRGRGGFGSRGGGRNWNNRGSHGGCRGYESRRGGHEGRGRREDASDTSSSRDDRSTPSAQQGESECSVCRDRPVNAVFVRCGHTSCCIECASILKGMGNKCPICRAEIDDVIQMFKA